MAAFHSSENMVERISLETLEEIATVSVQEPATFEEVSEMLAYDADTGKIWWKKKPAKNILVGEEAGSVKSTRKDAQGQPVFYRYVRLNGQSVPAARIAWLLHTGEWPTSRMKNKDGDTLNVAFANLELANGASAKYDFSDGEDRLDYQREYMRNNGLFWKDRHLQKMFGISMHEYGKMLLAQDGKCAICKCDETSKRNGVVRALAVDHDHRNGKIRGLLCNDCNQSLGKFKDDREVLLAAVRYLDKHSGADNSAPNLTVIEGDA